VLLRIRRGEQWEGVDLCLRLRHGPGRHGRSISIFLYDHSKITAASYIIFLVDVKFLGIEHMTA
jgi:hypothetical protein